MKTITIHPVGKVFSPRKDLMDDYWGGVVSEIRIDPEQFTAEAVSELESFSHLEIVFFMDRVPREKIQRGARHPRNRMDWPKVGIFAQRAKARPNCIGVSCCRLLKVEGLVLSVEGLDAIDQTPVLDIKPYMKEFGPRGPVRQPEWAKEVMRFYYESKEDPV
jgi:tRNA (adenine37-N6)-methyltransferase